MDRWNAVTCIDKRGEFRMVPIFRLTILLCTFSMVLLSTSFVARIEDFVVFWFFREIAVP